MVIASPARKANLTWVYNRYRATPICKGKLHISWKLLHKLTVRSASTDINVCISPSENLDRSARVIHRHF
uniref:Uncharacterized protein MANES_11G066800 n=1 Tax=Rhizophora mucronata TaxID=61149 RepID=A0A2P2M4M9_RHIMU